MGEDKISQAEIGTAGSLEDPRIKVAEKAIEFLEKAIDNPEIFENGPWIGWFSSTSLKKQIVAISAIPLGLA